MRNRNTISLIVAGLLMIWPALADDTPPPETARADFKAGVMAYRLGHYGKALVLWQPYAEQGDPAAMRNLAHLYKNGLGTPQDLGKAFTYYQQAADAGLVSAKANLALAYYKGEGTDKNLHEARYWFEQAAIGGSALGAFHLAHMMEHSLGGIRDRQSALEWYAVAALAGVPPAANRLADLVAQVQPPHSIRAYRSQGRPPPGAARGGIHKQEPFEPPSILEQYRPGALR